MNPLDDEISSKASEFSRGIEAFGKPIEKAKAHFRKLIENEKDPLKQAKLREFLPYVEKALDVSELEWFETKAIQTAEAVRKLADLAEEKVREKKNIGKAILKSWMIFGVIALIILGTGIGKVYRYRFEDGKVSTSEEFEGQHYLVGINKVPAEFIGETYALRRQPVLRIGFLMILFMIFFAKTLWREGEREQD